MAAARRRGCKAFYGLKEAIYPLSRWSKKNFTAPSGARCIGASAEKTLKTGTKTVFPFSVRVFSQDAKAFFN
jgi:hypothetical protein